MSKTYELTLGAMAIAIIALMAFVPQLGYIKINLVDVTIIHIPVLIFAMSSNRKIAIIAGLSFGISSFLVALTRAADPVSVIFQNPIVSVLPRLGFALLAYYLFKVLRKTKLNDLTSLAITSFIATLAHTISVLCLLYLFGQSIFVDGLIKFLMGVIATNGIIEIILATIIVPPIVMVLRKTIK